MTLRFSEPRSLSGGFGLTLLDPLTGTPELVTPVGVEIDGIGRPAWVRESEATYVFFGLAAGAHTAHVRAPAERPYYQPKDIDLVLPVTDPRWPMFPDPMLADPNKVLDDPAQTAAYLAQRSAATLAFTPAYPFPDGSTLVRGSVMRPGNLPVNGATVARTGGSEIYVTGPDGQFVLFLAQASALGETVTLHATAPARPPVDLPVRIRRGLTSTATINI